MSPAEQLTAAGWKRDDERWRSPSELITVLRDAKGVLVAAWRRTGPQSFTFAGERSGKRAAWPRAVRLAMRAERLLSRWAEALPWTTCEACRGTFLRPPGASYRTCDGCFPEAP